MENEENKVRDGEVSETQKPEEKIEASMEVSTESSKTKKRKKDFLIELALFLILGALIGIAVKSEAVKRITIGFDDYKMKIGKQDYNINQIQKDLNAKMAEAQKQQEQNAEDAPSDQLENIQDDSQPVDEQE